MVYKLTVDYGERYCQLSRLGRETFCASVAQANLLRVAPTAVVKEQLALGTGSGIASTDSAGDAFDVPGRLGLERYLSSQEVPTQEIRPLVKKLGTPFVDLITIGRTNGNDIEVVDASVSRFHAFFRRRHQQWFVCDAGSSNGTFVDGKALAPRTEAEILNLTSLRLGCVDFVFHTADSLYDLLANRPNRDAEMHR